MKKEREKKSKKKKRKREVHGKERGKGRGGRNHPFHTSTWGPGRKVWGIGGTEEEKREKGKKEKGPFGPFCLCKFRSCEKTPEEK